MKFKVFVFAQIGLALFALLLSITIFFFFRPHAEASRAPTLLPLSNKGEIFRLLFEDGKERSSSNKEDTIGEVLENLIIKSPYFEKKYKISELGFIATDETDEALKNQMPMLRTKSGALFAFDSSNLDNLIDYAENIINRESSEGRWDFEHKRPIPGIDGAKLLRDELKDRIFEAVKEGKSEIECPILVLESKSKMSQIPEGFQPSVVLGTYSTTFSRSKNRTINVKLAASYLDGVLLMPGASMSYNELVGDRTEERGFKDAPVIVQGQMVEGIGGGACQVSSTIHAAAVFAGIEITERYNHSLASSYIETGLDAVVSYPLLDLKLKNNSDRPVVLDINIKENVMTATFRSDKAFDRVVFRKEVTETVPFVENVYLDPTMEENTFKIKKAGKDGYKVQRGRIRHTDKGEVFEKFLTDVYQSQPQIVLVGPNTEYPPPPPETENVQ